MQALKKLSQNKNNHQKIFVKQKIRGWVWGTIPFFSEKLAYKKLPSYSASKIFFGIFYRNDIIVDK